MANPPLGNRQIPPSFHLVLIISLLMLIWGYLPGWLSVIETWQSDPDYNHGFLVIPIAAWLLWQHRKDLASISIAGSWWGLCPIVLAVVMRIAGAEFFFPEFDTWSIPFWIAGVVLLFGGWQLLRWSAGSIAFLWFMTPIPGTITALLSLPLQKISAMLSTWTLLTCAQPAIRQGTTIMLGEHILEVERACSGLRICYGVTALAVAYVLLNRPGWIRSMILLLMAIPVAIIANSARVTLTGLLFAVVSGDVAKKWSHDFAGFLMLPLAFLLLWMVAKFLDRVIAAFEESPVAGSRFVLKYAAITSVVGVLLIYWHGWQSDLALETLLKVASRHELTAQELEDEGKKRESLQEWSRALVAFEQYRALKPEQLEVAKRAALAAEKLVFSQASSVRAARLFETAWKLLPEDHELGLKCAEYASQGNLPSLAVETTQQLMKSLKPGDEQYRKAFGLRLQALILDANGPNPKFGWTEIAKQLKFGFENDIDPVACAFQLGLAYQQHAVEGVNDSQREPEAAEVFRSLLQRRPDDPLAHYAFSVFLRQYPRVGSIQIEKNETNAATTDTPGPESTPSQKPTDADLELDAAMRLAGESLTKENLPIWVAAGVRALGEQKWADATQYFRNAVQCSPESSFSHIQLSRLLSGRAENRTLRELMPEQHQLAVGVLKGALQNATLDERLLVEFELLRHQLRMNDEASQSEARELLGRLSESCSKLPPDTGSSFLLELAMIESLAIAESGNLEDAIRRLSAALEEDWIESIPKGPGLLSNAWTALGNWYIQQNDKTAATRCFAKAREVEPKSLPSLYQQYVGAEMLNQPEAASEFLNGMLTLMGNRPDLWISKANNELKAQLGRSPQDRDFTQLNLALQRAKELRANQADIAAVQADMITAQQGDLAGLLFLEDQTNLGVENANLWRAIAILRFRTGKVDRVEEAVQRYSAVSQDPANTLVLRSELKIMQGDVEGARQLLQNAIELETRPEQRQRLQSSYLRLTSITDPSSADAMLEQSLKNNSTDLNALAQLAELRWSRSDFEGHEAVEEAIKKIEGQDGVLWRELRVRRLLLQSQESADAELRASLKEQARSLLSEIVQRSGSTNAGTLICEGRLAFLDGQLLNATQKYEEAWKVGARSAPLAVELLQSLVAVGNFDDIRRYLGQMHDLVLSTPQLFDIAIIFSPDTVTEDLGLFVRRVDAWNESEKSSVSALRVARLGRLRLKAKSGDANLVDATEAAFRTAIERDPRNPQPLGEYFQFVMDDLKDAPRVLKELDAVYQSSEIPLLDRHFMTAQLLGQMQLRGLSLFHWKKAVELSEQSSSSVRTRILNLAARAFFDSNSGRAIDYVRRSVQLEPQVRSHKVLLSLLLTRRGAVPDHHEALSAVNELLDSANLANGVLTDEESRVAAEVYYQNALQKETANTPDSKAMLARADQLLRGIRKPTDEDWVLTTRVAFESGDAADALRTEFQRLSLPDASPIAIRQFVEFFWTKFRGNAPEVRSLETLLDSMYRRPGQELLALNLRLSEPDLAADRIFAVSDEFLSKIVASKTKNEGQREFLQAAMGILLSKSQFDAWMKCVEKDHKLISRDTKLQAATLALLFAKQDKAKEEAFRSYLRQQIAELKSVELEQIAADYFFSRQEWADAEQLYRRCLERNATDLKALNNLALVIAESRKEFEESHRLILTALEAHRSSAIQSDANFLLDTQSQLWLAANEPEKCVSTLEMLVRSVASDPGTCLHYAECLRQLGRLDESREMFQRAVETGLNVDLLQPIDLRFWEELGKSQSTEQASAARME